MAMTRGAPAPEQAAVLNSGIEGTALDTPIQHCYVCGKRGLRMRTVNGRLGLAVCARCEPVPPAEKTERKMERGVPAAQIDPENTVCCVCKSDLIDLKKLARRERQLLHIDLSERDREHLQQQTKEKGWRNIGNGQYAHVKCLKVRRKS